MDNEYTINAIRAIKNETLLALRDKVAYGYQLQENVLDSDGFDEFYFGKSEAYADVLKMIDEAIQ